MQHIMHQTKRASPGQGRLVNIQESMVVFGFRLTFEVRRSTIYPAFIQNPLTGSAGQGKWGPELL